MELISEGDLADTFILARLQMSDGLPSFIFPFQYLHIHVALILVLQISLLRN